MTTLITGGGSRIGIVLSQLLTAANHKVLFASRSGRVPDGFNAVKFDWDDPTTFDAPFKADSDIKYIYLLAPNDHTDFLPPVKPFIDLAVQKGVKRIILLSATICDPAGPELIAQAAIHNYLEKQGLDYVALRPTWFLENFLRRFRGSIVKKNTLETIAPNGRIAFVAVEDIAQAAFTAIVDRSALPSNAPYVVGPKLLSYPEVADIFSEVLGRKITHVTVGSEDLYNVFVGYGIQPTYARHLVELEELAEKGLDEGFISDPRAFIGKIGVKEWIETHKEAFAV